MNGHWVDTIQIKAGLFVLQTTHTVIIVFYIHLPIPQTGCRTFQKFQRFSIHPHAHFGQITGSTT